MQHGERAGRQGRGDLVIVWSKGGALGAGGCLEAYFGRSSLATLGYLCPTDLTQSYNHFLRLVAGSCQCCHAGQIRLWRGGNRGPTTFSYLRKDFESQTYLKIFAWKPIHYSLYCKSNCGVGAVGSLMPDSPSVKEARHRGNVITPGPCEKNQVHLCIV